MISARVGVASHEGFFGVAHESGVAELPVGSFPALAAQGRGRRGSCGSGGRRIVDRLLVGGPLLGRVREVVIPGAVAPVVVVVQRLAFRFGPFAGSNPVHL